MNTEGWISTERLSWNSQTDTFIGEISELKIDKIPESLIIWNPKTMGSIYVSLDRRDYNTEGEIEGWRYSSFKGYSLLIIND
jgi:hypothetical protein